MGAAGKMTEVQGRRTIRPSARKFGHNKVNTAKGLRDRRIRLSPDTAIQFYDVQDRLGYERASEALDWLMQKAKHSIDNLSDTSSQQLEHLTHLNNSQVDAPGDYHSKSIFPYVQFQEMLENDQIQKTLLFGSKCNSSGEHFVFNYEVSAAVSHNDDSSSDHTTGPNSNSVQCMATAQYPSVIQTSEPSSSDDLVNMSTQSHGDQGQFLSFNHSFISDSSFPSWMARF